VAATASQGRGDQDTVQARASPEVKRYDIRWVDLDPVSGAEMARTRPAVIVSLDQLNAVLQTVTICPLTSQLHPGWRTRMQVRIGGHPGEIAVDQIRTISKSRIGRKLGALTSKESSLLRRIITELYGE
jgi:mRNA interferase MazF